MRKLSIDEEKKIELEILTYFADFCEENNINYFLGYGTLIGALRHKGFIPWDDDVDIVVFREDADKLCELFPKDGRYRLIKPTDKISRHGIIKIIDTKTVKIENKVDYKNGELGVDIDLFTFNGEPDDDKTFHKWERKLHKLTMYQAHTITDASKCRIKGKVYLTIFNLFHKRDRILKKRKKLHDKYPFETSKYIGNMENFDNNPKDRFTKDLFASYIMVEFEGKKFRAPVGYDKYLRKVYGDYMKMPPKEKQVTHHNCVCYIKED